MRSLSDNNEPVILRLPASRSADQALPSPTVRHRRPRKVGITRTIGWASAALFIALWGPALCGLVYTADDLGAFHLPLRAFYSGALAGGDAFDWCPSLFGGFYLTGEGQAGTYHPLHWLVYRWLPLAWAWNVECLASYAFLFGGIWLLLRRRGLAHAESLFGALVFTFSGFNLLHFVHVNAIGVVAHIPWLLYAINRFATRCPTWHSVMRTVCLLAALTGSQLLLGYPQYVAYSLLAEMLYVMFVPREQKTATDKPAWWQCSGVWVAAKLLGLALGAVQIAPTIEALADSVRQSGDASFSASGSLHPLNFVQLVAPYLFTTRVVGQNTHELSVYVGIVPLLLSIVALARRHPDQSGTLRSAKRFALALVLLGGLIALGKHGPLHKLLTYLPLTAYFRFPCRAIVLCELGIGLLAAMGFAKIYRGVRSRRPIELATKTLWLVAAAGLAIALLGPALWPDHTASGLPLWYGPLALGIAIALLHAAARGSRLALHAVVVLAAIDLGAYGLSYAVYRDTYHLQDYIADTRAPQSQPGERVALDLARPNDEAIKVGNQILLRGFSRIDGYAGLVPARRLDYRQPAALRAAGVVAVSEDARIAESDNPPMASDGWLQIGKPMPRARLVRSYRATDEPAAEISHIDLEKEVLIELADLQFVAAGLASRSSALSDDLPSGDFANFVSDRPGAMVIDVDASGPAILVVGESYHRGWTVEITETGTVPAQGRRLHEPNTVPARGRRLRGENTGPARDGRSPEPRVMRINGDFLGCLVPVGHWTVEFRFAPTSLRYGRLISVCGLGLIVILAAAATWRRPFFAGRPAHVPRFRATLSD